MAIGVVLVTYNASDIIIECIESLVASQGADLRIVVVDNASRDDSVATVRDWAAGRKTLGPAEGFRPFTPADHGPFAVIDSPEGIAHLGPNQIGLLAQTENRGFAGGVNVGLRALLANPEIEQFWVLNPDGIARPDTARLMLEKASQIGRFAVMGGRIYYTTPLDMIQSDGGKVNLWTGICNPLNLSAVGADTPAPKGSDLDYISGSHMFVSREFVETAGLMPEDYFLYYEEVDWCLRRGDLPLIFLPEAAIHHHGGHTIGSPTMTKGPSPLSTYFLNRARMKFMARHRPIALPLAFVYSAARATRAILRGQRDAGIAALRGITGLPPTQAMYDRIGRRDLPR